MRRLLSTLLLLLYPLIFVQALHEKDVGKVDWYKPLIGVPITASSNGSNEKLALTLAPSFHRIYVPPPANEPHKKGTTKSYVVTATESNVLAVLDAVDGALVWRWLFDGGEVVNGYWREYEYLASLSGPPSGKWSTLRLFSMHTGELVIEKRLNHQAGNAASVVFGHGEKLIYVLHGDTVSCVGINVSGASQNAEVRWEWSAENIHTITMFAPTDKSAEKVLYVLGQSGTAYTLAPLNPTSGTLTAGVDKPLPIPITGSIDVQLDTVILKDSFVWIEPSSGTLKSIPLNAAGSKLKANKAKGNWHSIKDVGLSQTHGLFVGVKSDMSAVVLEVTTGNEIKEVWAFEGSGGVSEGATPLYSGGFDKDMNPYVIRLYALHQVQMVQVEVLVPPSPKLEHSFLTGFTVPHFSIRSGVESLPLSIQHGDFAHVAADFARPNIKQNPYQVLSRLVVSTNSGGLMLWMADGKAPTWIRDEGVADVGQPDGKGAVVFVELPAPEVAGTRLGEESYVDRLVRHIVGLKDLPTYIQSYVYRFLYGSSVEASVSDEPGIVSQMVASFLGTKPRTKKSTKPAILLPPSSISAETNVTVARERVKKIMERDMFGFNQLIVLTSRKGKVYTLSSATGEEIWSKQLVSPFSDVEKIAITPLKATVLKESGEDRRAEVAVVVEFKALSTNEVKTVVYHFNAYTGQNIGPNASVKGLLKGSEVLTTGDGKLLDVIVIPNDETARNMIVMIDQAPGAHIYPPTPSNIDYFRKMIASESSLAWNLPLLRSTSTSKVALTGHQFLALESVPKGTGSAPASDATLYPTYQLSLPSSEKIVSLIHPSASSSMAGAGVASLGKVLGNRTTMYKYLSGRVWGIVTTSGDLTPSAETEATKTSAKPSCGVYLLDSVKGTVLYRASLPTSSSGCDTVNMVISENWMVYSYFDPTDAKAWKLVSVEVYEGVVDKKVSSPDLSSYSNETLEMNVYKQAYLFSAGAGSGGGGGIKSIGFTESRWGITMKDLIVATTTNKVLTIPRRLLDPRRTVGRKPTNEEMSEEFLLPYDPVLGDDGRRVVSHNYEVAQTTSLITSPTLLESTSLLLSYGTLDIFLTRVSPSKTFDLLSEDFNKTQLVSIVAILLGGVFVSRRWVARKRSLKWGTEQES